MRRGGGGHHVETSVREGVHEEHYTIEGGIGCSLRESGQWEQSMYQKRKWEAVCVRDGAWFVLTSRSYKKLYGLGKMEKTGKKINFNQSVVTL